MAYEQRVNSGSLFKNKDPRTDKSPNVTGNALLRVGDQLVEIGLSGWTKENEKIGKWLSLSLKIKGTRPAEPVDNSDVDQALGK
jgi:hypothetical protein